MNFFIFVFMEKLIASWDLVVVPTPWITTCLLAIVGHFPLLPSRIVKKKLTILPIIPITVWMVHLTHRGRVTHICVNDLTSIGSDNGLSPDRRQAIIRTNAGILLIRPLGTNFSEFSVEILIFSFKKMRLKVSSAEMRPFCLGLNVLSFGPSMTSRNIMACCIYTSPKSIPYVTQIFCCAGNDWM